MCACPSDTCREDAYPDGSANPDGCSGGFYYRPDSMCYLFGYEDAASHCDEPDFCGPDCVRIHCPSPHHPVPTNGACSGC